MLADYNKFKGTSYQLSDLIAKEPHISGSSSAVALSFDILGCYLAALNAKTNGFALSAKDGTVLFVDIVAMHIHSVQMVFMDALCPLLQVAMELQRQNWQQLTADGGLTRTLGTQTPIIGEIYPQFQLQCYQHITVHVTERRNANRMKFVTVQGT